MLFPARDFLLEFKREGSFQSPLKMYFSPLNNGLLSAPGGLGCDRVSAAGEKKPAGLGQENSAPKRALPCADYFVAPYPVRLHPPSIHPPPK